MSQSHPTLWGGFVTKALISFSKWRLEEKFELLLYLLLNSAITIINFNFLFNITLVAKIRHNMQNVSQSHPVLRGTLLNTARFDDNNDTITA